MTRLIRKLWNSSPKQVSRALRARLSGERGRVERVPPEWRRVQGGPLKDCELLLAPSMGADWRAMERGEYEPFMLEALAGEINLRGRTVWDVGAHSGYHTLCFAAGVGETGSVAAFEPNPATHERLGANITRNEALAARIRRFQVALSDRKGKLEFIYDEGVDVRNTCSHLAQASPPLEGDAYENFKTTTVETVTADELIASENLPSPDVMKIDVEGAEELVLSGCRGLLERKRPHLLIEVHNISLMFEVQRELHRCGYRMKLIDEEHATLSRAFLFACPEPA